MADDLDLIRAAFGKSLLAGMQINDSPGETLVMRDIDPAGLLDAWRAARSFVPVTGRWPVMIQPDYCSINDDGVDPSSLDALDRAAQRTDPWSDIVGEDDDVQDLIPGDQLADYDLYFRDEPAAAPEANRDLAMPTTTAALHRWIYDRLLANPGLRQRYQTQIDAYSGIGTWRTPDTVNLILLPTERPWLSPYWLDYYGALTPEHIDWLAAVEWQWHHLWGAELVASWGTMLQFVVDRPPAQGDQAWEVAGQILTVGGSLQVDRWLIALALPGSDAWFLHDRP